MTNDTATNPTLTITHPQSGWDGTFGNLVEKIADVLHDGPVAATALVQLDEPNKQLRVVGDWLRYEKNTDLIVIQITRNGTIVHIPVDDLVTLSI